MLLQKRATVVVRGRPQIWQVLWLDVKVEECQYRLKSRGESTEPWDTPAPIQNTVEIALDL